MFGVPFALPRLLVTDWRLMMTNIVMLKQIISNLGRTNLRPFVLPLALIFVALMPGRIFYRLLALPYDLLAVVSDLERERLARKISAEGANIYPLW